MAKNTTKQIQISLAPHVIEKLDSTAQTLGLTRSGVITVAMQSLIAFESPELGLALDKALRRLYSEVTKT